MSKKMQPIRKRENIENVKDTEECVYFGFRPSNKDIITLIKNDPALKIIFLPESYSKTLSKSMLMLFEMKNIKLVTESMQKSEHIESCYVLNDKALDLPENEASEDVPESVPEVPKEGDGTEPEGNDKSEANEEFGNLATAGSVNTENDF